jgi:hypothetical protein
MFTEGYIRFVNLNVLDDKREVTIVNGRATVVSTLAAQHYIVTAVCTDNAFNEMSMLNQLHTFSRSRQAGPPIISILCVAHTANVVLGGFLTESTGARLCDL